MKLGSKRVKFTVIDYADIWKNFLVALFGIAKMVL